MDEAGQDSPMPDRSATETEPDDPAAGVSSVRVDSRSNSIDSSEDMSRSNSAHDSPDQSNDATTAGERSNSTGWDTDPSLSSSASPKETGPPQVVGWFPISEDASVASPTEIAQMETLGEISALDEAHWINRLPELNDPEHVVSEQGKIEWTIHPFNGTLQNPKKDYVYKSPTVRIGGCSWRLKVFPKGLEGPYLAVNLECKNDDEGYNAQSSAGIPESVAQSDSPKLPWRIPAQFEVVVFNPQEPRVYFHKGSSQSFSRRSPSCSFKRFAPVNIMDIGMRLPHQRQALLRNDTLGVTAYIRTFRDESGCLFLRNVDAWDSFSISGLRGIHPIRNRSLYNQSLLAAVTTWLFLPPLQRILVAIKESRKTDPNLAYTPLATALLQMCKSVKHKEVSPDDAVELEDIESALSWHGATVQDNADVFEVWELLNGVLREELKNLPSQTLMDDFLRLGPPRIPVPYDDTRTIKDAQALISSNDLLKNNPSCPSRQGSIPSNSYVPQTLHIQLPRQRFDTEKRRWKKSRRAYELNEYLIDPAKYKLHAIILHEDSDLKSRAFSTIVRADGKNFYKFGPDYQRVMRLTRQQALVDSKNSTFAAIYVLQASENENPTCQVSADSWLDEAIKSPDEEPGELYSHPVQLTFVNSNTFNDTPHPGFLDQYYLSSSLNLQLTLKTAEDFQNVIANVERFFLHGQDDDKRCYIWELDQSLSRFNPDFMVANLSAKSLSNRRSEPGFFWVCVASKRQIDVENPPEPEDSTKIAEDEPKDTAVEAVDAEQSDSSKMGTEKPQDASEDVTMTDVTADATAEITADVETIKVATPDPDNMAETYVFVKYFDPEAQTLKGVWNYIARRDQQTRLSVRENAPFLFEEERQYLFFQEDDASCEDMITRLKPLAEADLIRNATADFSRIIIVQPVLPQSKKDKVSLDGGIVELQDFLPYLFTKHFNPSKIETDGQVVAKNYFGTSWYEGTFSCGLPHGLGKEITLTGEEYIGSFKMGLRNGQGLLRLQNYNTYEGEFWDGHPHGTGKHVEALTGNTYTGGFQRGKKRGRGTTEWQQAEEEAKVCRVCYENEQDCAFYPCGHVCACLECAKMASNCPMCHREGSRPFKLYFAS